MKQEQYNNLNSKYMEVAIEEATYGIKNNHGGPFGCVIVKDDKIIGKGHNRVLLENPTLHGEMVAIRDTCKNIDDFDLTGCELYTTGEPCLMCLGAILWANIDKIYYGCTIKDTNDIGFRDDVFDDYLTVDRTKLIQSGNYIELDRDKCKVLFKEYELLNRSRY